MIVTTLLNADIFLQLDSSQTSSVAMHVQEEPSHPSVLDVLAMRQTNVRFTSVFKALDPQDPELVFHTVQEHAVRLEVLFFFKFALIPRLIIQNSERRERTVLLSIQGIEQILLSVVQPGVVHVWLLVHGA